MSCRTDIRVPYSRHGFPAVIADGFCSFACAICGRAQFIQASAALLAFAATTSICIAQESEFAISMSRVVEHRLSAYKECHAQITSTSEEKGSQYKVAIEAWVKGDRIRNDMTSPSGLSHSIVSGGTYIAIHPGEESPLVAPTSEKSDVWQYLGIVHPASVGVSSMGLDIYRGGENHWISKGWMRSNDARKKMKKTVEGNLIKYALQMPSEFPVGVPFESLRDPERLREYLKDNPETTIVNLELRNEAVFSTVMNGQLVSYYQSQSRPNGENLTETILTNQYAFDTASGYWVPTTSESEVRFNGEVLKKTVTTVELIEFLPVKDSVFTVEGIGFPEGTRIRERDNAGMPRTAFIENGKRVYPKFDEYIEGTTPIPVLDNGRWRKFLMGINFLVISLVAAVLLFRYWRRNF
jgi:hypothetical protein